MLPHMGNTKPLYMNMFLYNLWPIIVHSFPGDIPLDISNPIVTLHFRGSPYLNHGTNQVTYFKFLLPQDSTGFDNLKARFLYNMLETGHTKMWLIDNYWYLERIDIWAYQQLFSNPTIKDLNNSEMLRWSKVLEIFAFKDQTIVRDHPVSPREMLSYCSKCIVGNNLDINTLSNASTGVIASLTTPTFGITSGVTTSNVEATHALTTIGLTPGLTSYSPSNIINPFNQDR